MNTDDIRGELETFISSPILFPAQLEMKPPGEANENLEVSVRIKVRITVPLGGTDRAQFEKRKAAAIVEATRRIERINPEYFSPVAMSREGFMARIAKQPWNKP